MFNMARDINHCCVWCFNLIPCAHGSSKILFKAGNPGLTETNNPNLINCRGRLELLHPLSATVVGNV